MTSVAQSTRSTREFTLASNIGLTGSELLDKLQQNKLQCNLLAILLIDFCFLLNESAYWFAASCNFTKF